VEKCSRKKTSDARIRSKLFGAAAEVKEEGAEAAASRSVEGYQTLGENRTEYAGWGQVSGFPEERGGKRSAGGGASGAWT